MKVIIAPDAFKGSLTAKEAAHAMKRGIEHVFSDAAIICLPIADGGEGTLEALVSATNGRYKETIVQDPLGRLIPAKLGVLGDGKTAVVELAQASGITLLAEEELDPLKASTYGTGELIRFALDEGYRKLIIGLGGSATNDGGTGMLEALGVRFFDAAGRLLKMNGGALSLIASIDDTELDERLHSTQIVVASDVENPLVGKTGATSIFGPQKGVKQAMIEPLDAGMRHFADVTERLKGKRLHGLRGAGAAGGSAGALVAYCDAEVASGIEVVLEAIGFAKHLSSVDFIVTGEGKTDRQTLDGKALLGVAKLAKDYKVPVYVISGSVEKEALDPLGEWFTGLDELNDGRPVAELMVNASEILRQKTEEIFSDRHM